MTTLNFDLNFQTNNQSIWNTGNQFSFQDNRFLGWNWDESGSKTVAGVGVSGSTSGKAGLQSDLSLQGGSVNASLPIDLWLDIPSNVRPGDTVTISSGFSLSDAANFSTYSPTASYGLDLIFGLDAAAGVRAFGRNYNIFDINIPQTQKNLLSINPNNSNFSLSPDQLNGFGSFDLHLPNVNSQGSLALPNTLSSVSSDTFLKATLDLDKLATTVLNTVGVPVPPLENDFSWWRFSGGYNLLDLELAPELTLSQEFNLLAEDLTGQLILENGQSIPFTVGENVTFTVPDGVGDALDIDAVFNLDANFSNKTTLGLDADLDLEALSLNANVDAPWPIPDFGFDFGPLFDENFNLFSGDVDVYNQTFDLSGFNSQSLSFDIPLEEENTTSTNYYPGTMSSNPYSNSTYLNESYTDDVYIFDITETSSINLNLHNISEGDDADLYLYQDTNGSGSLDLDGTDLLLASSSRGGNSDDSINYLQGAGTYFAKVSSYSLGDDNYLNYELDLSATPTYQSPNLLPVEVDVTGMDFSTNALTYSYYGDVGNSNTSDIYAFSIPEIATSPAAIDISLSGLSNDADIRVIRDFNNNRIVDSYDEVIGSSSNSGTNSELIQQLTGSGNYFVQVSQYGGDTNYQLDFTSYSISPTV